MLDIRSSRNMMHLRCQFCDRNPGYLRAFGKDWTCMNCVYEFGLEDHEFMGEEVVCFSPETEFEATHHISSTTHYYSIEPWKPRRAVVKIEEIPFNGDLADATSFYLFNLEAIKGKKGKCKMTVEIFD